MRRGPSQQKRIRLISYISHVSILALTLGSPRFDCLVLLLSPLRWRQMVVHARREYIEIMHIYKIIQHGSEAAGRRNLHTVESYSICLIARLLAGCDTVEHVAMTSGGDTACPQDVCACLSSCPTCLEKNMQKHCRPEAGQGSKRAVYHKYIGSASYPIASRQQAILKMHKEGKHETPSRENMKPSFTGIHLLGACVMAGRPTAGSGDAYAHEEGNHFPPFRKC